MLCSVHLNFRPMWEDEANIKGGRWLFTVGKSSKEALDRIWLDILLMMVGESFEYASEICGAVVNIRAKSNKICKYTSSSHNNLFEYIISNRFCSCLDS